MNLPIKLLNPDAKMPTKGSSGSAGYDLYASIEDPWAIECGQRVAVPTGISVAIPEGYYGRIAPRSGLAYKHGIDVFGGVIDSDYRGEIKAILYNTEGDDFQMKPGDRIAQLIIERCHDVKFIEFDELPPSDRGNGGFGSTGE